MRSLNTVAYAASIALVLGTSWTGFTGTTPAAHGNADAYAINGTYIATSDGNFATTDYAFHDEATVTSTWTITSQCTTDVNCTGQVTSDQGWTAPLRTEGHVWYVEHDVPNWQTCPGGGPAFKGRQTFSFYPANANGVTQIGSPYLEGKDHTVGPRFACGTYWYGKPLVIVMPFRLDKIG